MGVLMFGISGLSGSQVATALGVAVGVKVAPMLLARIPLVAGVDPRIPAVAVGAAYLSWSGRPKGRARNLTDGVVMGALAETVGSFIPVG